MSEQAEQAIMDRVMAGKTGDCECCCDEPSVGVAAVPFVPMTIAWGRRCLEADVVPLWVCFAQIGACGYEGQGMERPPEVTYGRGMFSEEWLDWHDRTLAYFNVTDEEFWTAVNA